MKNAVWALLCLGGLACSGSDRDADADAPPDPTDSADTAEATAVHTGDTDSPTEPTLTVGGHAPVLEGPSLTVSPPAQTFVGAITVTLSSDDPDAEILYTLDGSRPRYATAERYTAPLELTESATLRAVVHTVDHTGQAVAPTYLALEPDVDGFSSDIPLVVLFSEDLAPVDKVEQYTTFSLSVFEPDGTGRVTWPAEATHSGRAGVRVRGSSTASFPKKPYRVETWRPLVDLDDRVALLGMPEDGDWVFQSPLQFDKALMRNPLMFALSNSVGRYAPRTAFAEVFVAELGETVGLEDYRGVYVVMERVERGGDRVDIERLEPTDLTEPEITGGYLFREDRTGFDEVGFTAGTAGGQLEFQQPFVYEDPDEAVIAPEQAQYLSDLLDELGEAVVAPDFTNPTTGRHYDEIIDVDSWIDHHVLNVFAKNADALRLSAYFHKDREAKLALGPLWDFDRSLGCDSDSRCEQADWWDATNQTSDTTDMFDHGFWRGLFADPVFRDAYFARMDQLLQVQLSVPVVHAQIDVYAAQLDEAAVRNFDEWSSYPPRDGSFQGEVDLLKQYVSDRHAWMTACLALPDPTTCTGD